MSDHDFGAIVVVAGAGGRPVVAGDSAVTYELGERWPYMNLPPHSGHTQELVEYQDAVLAHANTDDSWRVQEQLHCDCRARRVIAQTLVHRPSGRLWVTAKAERVSAAFSRGQRRLDEGWAMHGAPGEMPHIGTVSSCKACPQRWLVVSFVDRAALVRIKFATHGATVAP